MPWRLSPLTERDLEDIWSYVAEDASPAPADRLIDAIIDRFELLAEQPRMGRLRPEFGAGVRSFAVESHSSTMDSMATFSAPRHLKASHIKPWRDATDAERLDGSNGLLLSPHIDHLFDEGYITFSPSQELIIVPEVRDKLLDAWGIASGLASSRESRALTWIGIARTCSSAHSSSSRTRLITRFSTRRTKHMSDRLGGGQNFSRRPPPA
jgi:plasmid stabilization system protein ParE